MTDKGNYEVELEFYEIHRTKSGILLSEYSSSDLAERERLQEARDDDKFWLPLSQIEIEEEDHPTDKVKLRIPGWLAEKEGLV